MLRVILLSLVCSSAAIKLPPKVEALDAESLESEVSPPKVQAVDKEGVDAFSDEEMNLDAPINNLVVMTEINDNYIKQGLFENWMHFAKPHLNDSVTIIFDAPETETQQQIEKMADEGKLPFTPHFLDNDFRIVKLHQKPSKDPVRFGTRKYRQLMNRRPRAIRKLLEKGSSVMLVDLDTVWAKSPFKQIQEAGEHDLYITRDDQKGHFCGCFLYFRPTPNSIDIAKKWEESVKHDAHGNQQTLNSVLKHKKKLDLHVLKFDQFPPGNFADKAKDATIYHANWMIGADHKVSFFKKRNMWYNPNEQSVPAAPSNFVHPAPKKH